jgi:NitT/TauT family transport system substrate-binding protein
MPVAILAGCSAGGSGTGGAPPETSSIVIDAVPTADAAGLYIAQDDGFFAKQGLTVTINPIDGGEYGMGDLAPPSPTDPTGPPQPVRPINMRIIADSSQMQPGNQALYVMPNSGYKTVAELAKDHVKIGINSPNNIAQVLLGSLFEASGLPLGSIKQYVQPAFPLIPGDLANHTIGAAWLPEPFGTEAEQEYGAVQLADLDQGSLQNFPIGTIVGSAQWAKTHPNTIAAFLRAYDQGQQIADTDRGAVETALVKWTKVSALVAANMTLDTYPLAMDVPVMQRVPDAMFQFHVLGQRYNITDMIQPEPGEIGGS